MPGQKLRRSDAVTTRTIALRRRLRYLYAMRFHLESLYLLWSAPPARGRGRPAKHTPLEESALRSQ